jgi:hypothetical protein
MFDFFKKDLKIKRSITMQRLEALAYFLHLNRGGRSEGAPMLLPIPNFHPPPQMFAPVTGIKTRQEDRSEGH